MRDEAEKNYIKIRGGTRPVSQAVEICFLTPLDQHTAEHDAEGAKDGIRVDLVLAWLRCV
jgi:hypothetical protein